MYAGNQLSDSESDLDTNSDIVCTMSDHVGGSYDIDVEMAKYLIFLIQSTEMVASMMMI